MIEIPHLLLAVMVCLASAMMYHVTIVKDGWQAKIAVYVGTFMFAWFSLCANVVLLFSCWVVWPISPKWGRWLSSHAAQQGWVMGLIHILRSGELKVTGDLPDAQETAVVISNHQMDCDWWYMLALMRCLGQDPQVKVILKDQYKNIPIMGWGLKGFGFIMLKRNWQQDEADLKRQLQVFASDGAPLKLLIYPEGTTANISEKEKGDSFAQREGRPTFKHLILPRVTGFNACVKLLAETCPGACVYDITVGYGGYSGEIPTWDMGYEREIDRGVPNLRKLFQGDAIKPTHMHIERHTIEEVLEGGELWLDKQWAKKDALLESFIRNRRFTGVGPEVAQLRPSKSTLVTLVFGSLPIMFCWGLWCVTRWCYA
ncbi:unnamed protein product [Chrysoparadoxa australica]